MGEARENIVLQTDRASSQKLAELPVNYTDIQTAMLQIAKPIVTPMLGHNQLGDDTFNEAYQEEHDWLATVERLLKKDELGADVYVSWVAYHASMTQPVAQPQGISSLLPLLVAKADTIAMARHAMIVFKHTTEYLNPGQIPVMIGDQPLYARMKLLQLD